MKCQKRNNIALVSLSAPHYRRRIFELLEEQLGTSFVFGEDASSIKQLDLSKFKNVVIVPLRYIFKGQLYLMPRTIKNLNNYDVIIDDMGILCLTSWTNLLVSRIKGQKIYIWSHGWYGRESIWKKILKRIYSALSEGMFLYGDYARKLMIENGFNPKKLHVIHNSLDYDSQLEVREGLEKDEIFSKHFDNNNPVLIFIGRLTKVKRLELLIEALKILKQEEKIFNLVFVGDGSEKSRLMEYASRHGVSDNIWFYGASYDERENGKLLYNADLCVAPGNIGLTAIHAMTYGCPCISHNDFKNQMPEFEAITPGKTGSFFEFGSAESLANTIADWFKYNIGKREYIRQECYNEIDGNWNPHNQIEIIKSVIEK